MREEWRRHSIVMQSKVTRVTSLHSRAQLRSPLQPATLVPAMTEQSVNATLRTSMLQEAQPCRLMLTMPPSPLQQLPLPLQKHAAQQPSFSGRPVAQRCEGGGQQPHREPLLYQEPPCVTPRHLAPQAQPQLQPLQLPPSTPQLSSLLRRPTPGRAAAERCTLRASTRGRRELMKRARATLAQDPRSC